MQLEELQAQILDIESSERFNEVALRIFHLQSQNNPVYREYIKTLGVDEATVKDVSSIPFLPINFFKSHRVICEGAEPQLVFESSGTTGSVQSRHYIAKPELYIKSFTTCFEKFYGNVTDYCIIALLPSYADKAQSSLACMVDYLIKSSLHPESGFYYNNHIDLANQLTKLNQTSKKVLLLGVSFALVEFAKNHPQSLKNMIIMETGGMKGHAPEMVRSNLHQLLIDAFGVSTIHSEYGMTELLSQAYSNGHGVFEPPPWMKVTARDVYDPLKPCEVGVVGGLNIIDLANIYSCSFIATDDLGKFDSQGKFEIIGRIDHSDIRGCNLLIEIN